MIKVYVMATCPDCTQVKAEAAGDPRFELIDLGEHVKHLKAFLTLRDTHPAFDKVKARGNIGLPCFVMDDGSIDFSWQRVKQRMEEASIPTDKTQAVSIETPDMSTGATCSLDGKGC